jgi:hypothetical protein
MGTTSWRNLFLAGVCAVFAIASLTADDLATEEDGATSEPQPAKGEPDVRSESRRIGSASVRERMEMREAVKKALGYFRKKQDIKSGEYRGFLDANYPVAATSLAGLAMLASGVLPDEGKDADILAGCLNFLLARSREGSFLAEPGAANGAGSRMHGHCYAILFLTQIAGSLSEDREKRVSRVIKNGIKVIQNAQSKEGGWFYDGKNELDRDEASVTICAIQALRAARDAGFLIDRGRIARAIGYIKRCQKKSDGSFKYQLSGNSRTSLSLTAAAVSALNAAGVYRSDELSLGLDYMKKELRGYKKNPLNAINETYFYYGNFYVAQALWQENRTEWRLWNSRVRERLLRKQKAAGNWESAFGDVYATSMALLILQMPVGYLPIFER